MIMTGLPPILQSAKSTSAPAPACRPLLLAGQTLVDSPFSAAGPAQPSSAGAMQGNCQPARKAPHQNGPVILMSLPSILQSANLTLAPAPPPTPLPLAPQNSPVDSPFSAAGPCQPSSAGVMQGACRPVRKAPHKNGDVILTSLTPILQSANLTLAPPPPPTPPPLPPQNVGCLTALCRWPLSAILCRGDAGRLLACGLTSRSSRSLSSTAP